MPPSLSTKLYDLIKLYNVRKTFVVKYYLVPKKKNKKRQRPFVHVQTLQISNIINKIVIIKLAGYQESFLANYQLKKVKIVTVSQRFAGLISIE